MREFCLFCFDLDLLGRIPASLYTDGGKNLLEIFVWEWVGERHNWTGYYSLQYLKRATI